ncbi:MAG: antitoxin VapB family protein [archaeon]|nr:antitoxin VapB family protein [archaeon]
MGSKIVSLKDKAYERLASLKTNGKSFSDVILEHFGNKGKLDDFIGILSNSEADSLRKHTKRLRAKADKDMRARRNVLFRH